MTYTPGLHILSEFDTENTPLLHSSNPCKQHFDDLITRFDLAKVGEVYHDFPGGGFTAVLCLTESHLSIHTWPEFGLATFDVFLSNYKRDNTDKVREIHQATISFFEGTVRKQTELTR